MKKITILILITISVTSFAKDSGVKLASKVDTIVIQKAIESGIEFTNSGAEYQLILGGKAFNLSNDTQAIASNTASINNSWSGQKGSYQLSIGDEGVGAMSSAFNSNNANFSLIAYNPRSKGIAIIHGEIIVKLRPSYSAETIAASFNIDLSNNFEHISTAMYTVRKGQNIFTVANQLSAHPGVEFAELDITENFVTAQ